MRYSIICTGVLLGIIQKIYSESPLNKDPVPKSSQILQEKKIPDDIPKTVILQKAKVFIFTRGDILFPDDFNIYRMRRSSLENIQLQDINQSLAKFKDLVYRVSKQEINIELDIETDNNPLRLNNHYQLFNQDYLDNILGTKFNKNSFDADDKIYRGPFNNLFIIHPLLNEDSFFTKVNDTPTTVIGYYTHSLVDLKDGLVQKIFEGWIKTQPAEKQKIYQEQIDAFPALTRDEGFLKLDSKVEGHLEEGGHYRKGYCVLLDKEKCNSLSKKSGERVSFNYSSAISDPYQINFKGSKGMWSVGLGVPLKKEELLFIDLNNLNQKIIIQIPENIGLVEEVSIEPIKSARFFERSTSKTTILDIKDWALCNDTPTPFGDSSSLLNNDQLRLKNFGTDKNQILKELNSSSDTFRINALKKVKELKLKEGLEKAIEYLNHATPLLVEAAAEAIAALDIKEGWDALLRQIDRGFFDHNRIAALKHFLNRPYPGLELKLSSLLTCVDWHGRYEAVKVLLSLKTPEAERALTIFLHETEPAIRFLIIKNINIHSDFICKCLLWNAVNDVSEKVRNISYLKIIQSSFNEYKEEALKSMRNESIETRLSLITAMESQPSESYRSILHYAVVDENPKIRAAALKAFANLPGKVDKKEIENSFDDTNPEVKAALAEVKIKKGL